jgi:hypothetical protein
MTKLMSKLKGLSTKKDLDVQASWSAGRLVEVRYAPRERGVRVWTILRQQVGMGELLSSTMTDTSDL